METFKYVPLFIIIALIIIPRLYRLTSKMKSKNENKRNT